MFHKYIMLDFTKYGSPSVILEIRHPSKGTATVYIDITNACQTFRDSEKGGCWDILDIIQKIDNDYQVDVIDPIFRVTV